MSQENELDLAYEVQVGQAVTAGYFGGYSAKMQDIGKRELLGLEQGVVRKAAVSTETSEHAMYMDYARRLVRDLEGKGIVRTAVETTNLAVHSTGKDISASGLSRPCHFQLQCSCDGRKCRQEKCQGIQSLLLLQVAGASVASERIKKRPLI